MAYGFPPSLLRAIGLAITVATSLEERSLARGMLTSLYGFSRVTSIFDMMVRHRGRG